MSWGFTEKYQFLGGVKFKKTQYLEGDCLKSEKEGVVFWRGEVDTPMHTAIFIIFFI